jgi:hypothetical protein
MNLPTFFARVTKRMLTRSPSDTTWVKSIVMSAIASFRACMKPKYSSRL